MSRKCPGDWLPIDSRAALKSLRLDIASLSDYDAYLTNRVQFLLDATLRPDQYRAKQHHQGAYHRFHSWRAADARCPASTV